MREKESCDGSQISEKNKSRVIDLSLESSLSYKTPYANAHAISKSIRAAAMLLKWDEMLLTEPN